MSIPNIPLKETHTEITLIIYKIPFLANQSKKSLHLVTLTTQTKQSVHTSWVHENIKYFTDSAHRPHERHEQCPVTQASLVHHEL